jgi:hypothetical protein
MDFLDTLFEGMSVRERKEHAASPLQAHFKKSHVDTYDEEREIRDLNESTRDNGEEVKDEEQEMEEEEEEHDNFENGLCNLCRAIDWKFILSGIETPGRTVRDYRPHVSLKLHSFHTMQIYAPYCSFCRLVALAPNAALQEDHLDSPLILWYTNRAPWRLERIEGDDDYEFDPKKMTGSDCLSATSKITGRIIGHARREPEYRSWSTKIISHSRGRTRVESW